MWEKSSDGCEKCTGTLEENVKKSRGRRHRGRSIQSHGRAVIKQRVAKCVET